MPLEYKNIDKLKLFSGYLNIIHVVCQIGPYEATRTASLCKGSKTRSDYFCPKWQSSKPL